MRSERKKLGAKQVRTDRARAELINATIQMIAERGVPGVALTKVGGRAGGSRALAGYHFATRRELIEKAVTSLLDDDVRPDELGLAPLLGWMRDQARRATEGDVRLLALLQVAVGAGVDTEVPALRQAYWQRRSQMIQQHLSAGQARGAIRDDLEASRLAPVLLGQLHGDLLRIAATGEAGPEGFIELIERLLAPERPRSSGPKSAAPPQTAAVQPSLFRSDESSPSATD